MYKNNKVGVVVTAYNEELLLRRTIEELPAFVDRIIVVDDCSTDNTPEILSELSKSNPKIIPIYHSENRGVGGAVSSGYVWCRDHDIDVTVVVGGDAQMDPTDLSNVIDPVIDGRADFAKGNRLCDQKAREVIPKIRFIGNLILSYLTKIVSGYWHVTDSQTSYTAISKQALQQLPLEDIYPRYGMPNDFLVTLNINNMRVIDVPVKPVYGNGEKSGLIVGKVLFSIFFLLCRLFVKRMVQKYVLRDFHPLVMLYLFGAVLMLLDLGFLGRFAYHFIFLHENPQITLIAILFCSIIGIQSLLFAMVFDMQANRTLNANQTMRPGIMDESLIAERQATQLLSKQDEETFQIAKKNGTNKRVSEAA